MNVEILFQIAAVGIVVAVLNQILVKAEHQEYAVMVTVAGLVVVLLLVVDRIKGLFDALKSVFSL